MHKNTFDYQEPNDASKEKLATIRAAAKEYARILLANLPDCRQLAITLTKLEETAMWANKAVVQNQDKVAATETTDND